MWPFDRLFRKKSQQRRDEHPHFSLRELLEPVNTFSTEQIRTIRSRDEKEYGEWNDVVKQVDGMPQDVRISQATKMVARIGKTVAKQYGEQLVEHHFAINATKRFYMEMSRRQIESGSPFHQRNETDSAYEQSIKKAFGTEMALLSQLSDAIPLIVMFQKKFDRCQEMVLSYVQAFRDAINKEGADIRYVIKCMNAMEKSFERELRSKFPSAGG